MTPTDAARVAEKLTKSESFLLDWLSKEDFSQYGECRGAALGALVHYGLATIGPIPAGRTDPNYRLVSLTDDGLAAHTHLQSRSREQQG